MAIDDKKRFDENYDRIFGKANNEAEKLDDTLDDVVDKTQRIKLNTSETLKFSRELSAQEDKRLKLTKDLESSLLSSLGALIKGNYQEILTYNQKNLYLETV